MQEFGLNTGTNEKTDSNGIKKPDIPLDLASNKGVNDDDEASSISGFPGFGDESDQE